MKISIVVPCEVSRLNLFLRTLSDYITHGLDDDIEFVIVSRTIKKFSIPGVNTKLVKYKYKPKKYFNPSKALNLGVLNSTHQNIIITCPEVRPITNVIEQLRGLGRGNYVCQVSDANKNGTIRISLVNSNFRHKTPSYYFLAMYKREDIERINGWDEHFLDGIGYEDDDFGRRFVLAFTPYHFKVVDSIQGIHQWHQRNDIDSEGWTINRIKSNNKKKGTDILPIKGMVKDDN